MKEWRAIHSHFYTVRMWQEQVGEHEYEWRGEVQHVLSGATRYFRDWDSLIWFLTTMPEAGDEKN